jgi:hypothetical protein
MVTGVAGGVGAAVDGVAVAVGDEAPPDEDVAPQAAAAPASNTTRSDGRVMRDMSAD